MEEPQDGDGDGDGEMVRSGGRLEGALVFPEDLSSEQLESTRPAFGKD